MNEELEQRLLDSINKVAEWTEAAGEFAGEQAPIVVEEIIRWGWFSKLWPIPAGIALLIASNAVSRVVVEMKKQGPIGHRSTVDTDVQSVFMWILRITGCGGIIAGIWLAAYPLIAPRLYVIEVLRGML